MQLINIPRILPMSVYEETREAVRKTYRSLPSVLDVIEYGTIPTPGVSDMDFIVVVEPGAALTIPGLGNYTPNQQYAMSHTHYVVGVDTITQLRLLDPFIVRFDSLFGRFDYTLDDSHLLQLSEDELKAFSYDYPLTSWMLGMLRSLARIETLQTVDCRELLEDVKIWPYAYREMHRAGLTKKTEKDGLPVCRSIGKRWFSLSESQQQEFVIGAIQETHEAFREFFFLLQSAFQRSANECKVPSFICKKPPFANSLCVKLGAELFVYQPGRSAIKTHYTLYHSPFSSQTYERITHFLPLELSATQNRLLFEKGFVPDAFCRCVSTDLDTLPLWTHPILEKRTTLQNAMLKEVCSVRGGKLLGKTYGARHEPVESFSFRNIRGKLGGIYDRCIERCIDTSAGVLLSKTEGTCML